MKHRHRIGFDVHVRSPFIMAGLGASGVGIDTSALRDERGRPILPADHLKGLLKQAVLAVQAACGTAWPIDAWFGAESARERSHGVASGPDAYAPDRAHLVFADLIGEVMIVPGGAAAQRIRDWETAERKADASGTDLNEHGVQRVTGARHITRIQIDEDSGSAAQGMLQVVELAAPLAAVVPFRGDAIFYGDEAAARVLVAALTKALRIVPYFGGLRSVGFGEHIAQSSKVCLDAAEDIVPREHPASTTDTRIVVEGEFDRPFLVDATQVAANVYRGGTIVPGGALKGAIADMLAHAGHDPANRQSDWGRALSLLRLSHAVPVGPDGAPLDEATPLSTMYEPIGGRFACALDSLSPGLIHGCCADFPPDWKRETHGAYARLVRRPISNLPTLPRGHTVIVPTTGIAATGLLFVEAARSAWAADDAGQPLYPQRFRFSADFTDVLVDPSLHDVARGLRVLLETGIDAIGKTRARLTKVVATNAPAPTSAVADQSRWRILLETPGVLIDTESSSEIDRADAPDMSIADQLTAYFAEVVPGAVLERHFVQRRLVGGYVVQRHRRGSYRPMSLFEAGSCFLLVAPTAQANAVANRLTTLVRSGLPTYRWSAAGTPQEITDWRDTPYLPANGYGAIAVEAPAFGALAAGEP